MGCHKCQSTVLLICFYSFEVLVVYEQNVPRAGAVSTKCYLRSTYIRQLATP